MREEFGIFTDDCCLLEYPFPCKESQTFDCLAESLKSTYANNKSYHTEFFKARKSHCA